MKVLPQCPHECARSPVCTTTCRASCTATVSHHHTCDSASHLARRDEVDVAGGAHVRSSAGSPAPSHHPWRCLGHRLVGRVCRVCVRRSRAPGRSQKQTSNTNGHTNASASIQHDNTCHPYVHTNQPNRHHTRSTCCATLRSCVPSPPSSPTQSPPPEETTTAPARRRTPPRLVARPSPVRPATHIST